jgi:hypothetical protein
MDRSFLTAHLRDADESYGTHLVFTLKAACVLVSAALVIVIHGLIPCLFTTTGSNLLAGLQRDMAARRAQCDKKCETRRDGRADDIRADDMKAE